MNKRWLVSLASDSTPWTRFKTPGLDESHVVEWKRFFREPRAGIMRLAPGKKATYHRHREPEIYFPRKGSCRLFIDGESIEISAESCEGIFIPSNVPHGLYNNNNNGETFELFYIYLRVPDESREDDCGAIPTKSDLQESFTMPTESTTPAFPVEIAPSAHPAPADDSDFRITFCRFPSGEEDERTRISGQTMTFDFSAEFLNS